MRVFLAAMLSAVLGAGTVQAADPAPDYGKLAPIFARLAAEKHAPGVVYGVVADGKLAYVNAIGVQDTASNRPVTADSVFRIASMSKNFTALAVLKLRDEGKLSLDAPAESLIPELKALAYPTADSRKIRVSDLLNHTGGLVTDDPWGDRQLDMSEADFSKLLAGGLPFSRSPGMAMEYSNLGYALLGRIVTNLSGKSYGAYIEDSILRPLGMTASTYDVRTIPTERRAIGYSRIGEAWVEAPALGPGVFGAMGGLAVSANDYAKYVAWVLDAWPPRDGADDPILKRSTRREIVEGSNFPAVVSRTDKTDPAGCDRARVYGMGMIAYADCVLGPYFTHSGGLPGYGSNVVFMPERGVGVFAFANVTYAPASDYVREAAIELVKSGAFPPRAPLASPDLQSAMKSIGQIYAKGDVMAAKDALAMNVLLDADAARRNADISKLKAELGACKAPQALTSDTAMSATAVFDCERGRMSAHVLLAPTRPTTIQSYTLAAAQ